MTTLSQALTSGVEQLERAGVGEARANAEWLLAHATGLDRGGLFVHRERDMAEAELRRYRDWIGRRAGRVPLQHLTGEQEFHGLVFRTDPRALIPRPETEGLVDAALALELPPGARVVDLGTGSGCIAIALVSCRPDLQILAVDLSGEALELACENAARLGVGGQIRWSRGDYSTLARDRPGRFHLVVSNPPYVSEAEWQGLEPEVRDHDPRQALVSGPSGYEAHDEISRVAGELLLAGGYLLLEIGAGQSRRVARQLERDGFEQLDVRGDLAGIPRVVRARRPV